MSLIKYLKGLRRCWLCDSYDKKSNLKFVIYGIYNDHNRYFHMGCMEDIVCDPEGHLTSIIDKALWCQESLSKENIDKEKEEMIRKQRLSNASTTLREEVPRGTKDQDHETSAA